MYFPEGLENTPSKRKIFSNFVCFSECPNFKTYTKPHFRKIPLQALARLNALCALNASKDSQMCESVLFPRFCSLFTVCSSSSFNSTSFRQTIVARAYIAHCSALHCLLHSRHVLLIFD